MRKIVRPAALVLSALIALSALSGCKSSVSSSTAASSTAGSKIDTSKHVELTGYLLGEKPAGMDDVMTELNKKTEKDINCSVKINYLGWGEYVTKYPLLMASGQGVDFIFTATWALYGSEAKKGAFAAITEDELKTFMPLHYKATAAVAWQQAKFNGNIMMIPTSTPDCKTSTIIIRQDLAEKYGVDTSNVKSIADLEPYFAAIKKNEPTMTPMMVDKQKDLGQPFFAYLNSFAKEGWVTPSSSYPWMYDLEADSSTVKAVALNDPIMIDEFKKAGAKTKEWYSKGYINKNAMNNSTTSNDAFKNGKSATAFSNTIDTVNIDAAAQGNGWKINIIPNVDSAGYALHDAYIGNGVGIAATSQNKDRTLMFLDRIMEQKDYNMLVYYGIEGKNYTIDSKGKLGLPSGVTSANNTYPADAAGFWFTNKDQFPESATWSATYSAARANAKKLVKDTPLAAFNLDDTKIKTQNANLSSVISQYLWPIELGQVANVDSALSTFSKQMNDAGISDVMTETNSQIKTYLENQK